MNYQTHHHRKHKDPFYVQPLPKPFYHPSPTKDVDDKEAIKTPQRRSDPATLGRQEEDFLRGCPVFKTSALSDIRTLRDLPESKPDLPRQRDLITDGHLDESWTESEMPSSASAPGNTSGATFTTEDSEETSRSIEDCVVDVGDNGLRYDGADAGESVLQRYIERFRKSAPKSREERLKEKGDKPPFWWMHSSPGSRSDLTGSEAGERTKQPTESFSEPIVKRQLTKEVLLTLDEATLHLQTKTDRLLSKSELSLASSGMVVSTEGIGSSASVSSSTFVEEPYWPAFAKGQDSYHRPEPRLFPRKGERSRSANAASSSPADDILSRWRLRRRMDEATTDPFCRQLDKPSAGKPSRDPGLNSQLEEFRKKILSQKALVTHEDIHYERQRMAIMMDDMQQDGCALNKDVPQSAIQPSELSKDSVLERMQKITGSRGSTSATFGEAAAFNLRQEEPLQDASNSVNVGYNFSINNANFSDARLLKNSNQFLTAPALNKNNTASSGRQIQHDKNRNNEYNPGFRVDNFDSQVICDPKNNGFFLGSSTSEYLGGGHSSVGGERVGDLITGRDLYKVDRDGITEKEKAKIYGVSIAANEKADVVGVGITENERAKVEKSAIDQNPAGHIREVDAVIPADSQSRQAKYTQSKENTENNATETVQESPRDEQSNSQISAGNNQITTKEENYTHKGQKSAGKMGHGKQRSVGGMEHEKQRNAGKMGHEKQSSGKMGHENLYQFLEAEKPNSESKEAAMKLNENDTFVDMDCSSRSMGSEEGGEKAREFTFVDSDRRVHGENERKVHVDSERRVHVDSERRVHVDSERRVHVDSERMVHVDSERRVHVDSERRVHVDSERRVHVDSERRVHVDSERMVHVDSERRVHGDSERRVHGDKRLTREQEKRKLRDVKEKGQGKEDPSIGSEVLADITNEGIRQPGKKPYSHKSDPTKKMSNENKDLTICSDSELRKKSENFHVVSSESSPRSQSVTSRVSSSQKQPIQLTIAQTVTDHLFDGSALMSSVDSWASMFPQSPSLPHSQHGPAASRMSTTPSQREQDCTSVMASTDQADEECQSDGEFDDDPLLQILRKQRDLHLKQLKNIEKKLQDIDT